MIFYPVEFSQPPASVASTRADSTNQQIETIWGNRILGSSKKQILNLPRASNYLRSTYTVLGILSNAEMI